MSRLRLMSAIKKVQWAAFPFGMFALQQQRGPAGGSTTSKGTFSVNDI
jgi:hypothetical protein